MYTSIKTESKKRIEKRIYDENGNLHEGVLKVNADMYLAAAESIDTEITNLLTKIRVLECKSETLNSAVWDYVSALDYVKDNPDNEYAEERLKEADIMVRASLRMLND